MSEKINARKSQIIQGIISKLSHECEYYENVNASFIIKEMLQTEEFYQALEKPENASQIVDFALHEQATESSRFSSLQVLRDLLADYQEKHKSTKSPKKDDEDVVNMDNSDQEDEESKGSFMELMKNSVQGLVGLLLSQSLVKDNITNSYNTTANPPFGVCRLKLMEIFDILF